MCTVYPVRNVYRSGVNILRNNGMLAVMSSRFIPSIYSQPVRSFECIKLKSQNPYLIHCRYMAKIKNKSKKQTIIKINEEELSRHLDLEKMKNEFGSAVENFKILLVEQATLRTSLNSIENIKVKYDGDTYTIQDLADVGKKSGKEVILEMTAFVGAVPKVMEALRKSSLGLNPNQQGQTTIVVPVPKVTRERREVMFKGAKSLFNKCKDNIRNIQNKYIKKIESFEGMSEDDIFRLKAQLTSLGDKYVSEAEELLNIKQKELLSE